LNNMQSKGYIERSIAENTSPIVLVKKKDGGTHVCVDFREVNSLAETDSHLLPLIEEILGKLRTNSFFSKIDLREDYNQIKMEEQSQQYTAFRRRYGTFRYCDMPFGLKNSPSEFQRILEGIQSVFDENHVMVYLVDILICSETLEENKKMVKEVVKKLFSNGLRAKPEKCEFFKRELDYLGYRIGRGAVELSSEQLNKIEQ
jgi:Reverse transcriptase (RNA-dependent DNA polymerase)